MFAPETTREITKLEFDNILAKRFELQDNESAAKAEGRLPKLDKVIKEDAPAYPLMIIRMKDLKDIPIERMDLFRSCFFNCTIPKSISNASFLCSLFKDCLIEGCTFINVDFSCCVFSRSELKGCTFVNCDLSAEFKSCTIHECSFDKCKFYETTLLKSTMARNSFANSRLHLFKGISPKSHNDNNIYDNTFTNCTPLAEKKKITDLLNIPTHEKGYWNELQNKPVHTGRGDSIKKKRPPTKPVPKKRQSLIPNENGEFDELKFF